MFVYMARPYYIKKEDVKDFYKLQHKKLGIVLIAAAIALGIIQFFVSPRTIEMYQDLNIVLPLYSKIFNQVLPLVLASLFGYGVYLLFSQPDYSNLQSELKKYKAGEMISTLKLMNGKTELLFLFVIGLVVAITVLANVVPIYSLTSQL